MVPNLVPNPSCPITSSFFSHDILFLSALPLTLVPTPPTSGGMVRVGGGGKGREGKGKDSNPTLSPPPPRSFFTALRAVYPSPSSVHSCVSSSPVSHSFLYPFTNLSPSSSPSSPNFLVCFSSPPHCLSVCSAGAPCTPLHPPPSPPPSPNLSLSLRFYVNLYLRRFFTCLKPRSFRSSSHL